ncbi:MAG: outer membrane lipoprotein LolB [Betaproteobacteria bacterium]|nr:outer membrane lipoprotein LolB [Betaproteobacteria bacterium]
MKLAQAALLLAALLFLNGCASLPTATPAAPRAAPFDVLGRVLVNFDGRAITANVRWLHAADGDDIWLMTPTGQALAHIAETATGATITTADQTQYQAGSIEALTRRALGWILPARQMQHWLRGAPVPGIDAEIAERDAAGRITRMTQDGWRVSYDYYPVTENDGLPRRMELANGAQMLRLVIDSWRREAAGAEAPPSGRL